MEWANNTSQVLPLLKVEDSWLVNVEGAELSELFAQLDDALSHENLSPFFDTETLEAGLTQSLNQIL